MPRFRDFTDFPDPEFRSLPATSKRSSATSGGVAGGSPPVRSAEPLAARRSSLGSTPLQKITPGNNKRLALAVERLNVTLSSGKMRAQGLRQSGPSSRLDGRRTPAISEAMPARPTQVGISAPVQRAKAIAADRRVFNPTQGPKTLYGTPAAIKPSTAARFRFAFPGLSVPCVQRKTRKEVLFAKRQTGSVSSRKSKRRGPYSNIGC